MNTKFLTLGAVGMIGAAALAFGQTSNTYTPPQPPPVPSYQGSYNGQVVNADGNVVAQPSTPAPAPQTVYVQQQPTTVVYGSPYCYYPYYYPGYYAGPTVWVGGGWGWHGGWGWGGRGWAGGHGGHGGWRR